MKKSGIIAAAMLLITMSLTLCYGCTVTETETPVQVIEDISAEAANELIQENEGNQGFQIIDVRTPAEYGEGYIEGAANIDFNDEDFKERIGELDRDGVYLVYCKGGTRSSKAAVIMERLGFSKVYNMTGGMGGWQSAGLPTIK